MGFPQAFLAMGEALNVETASYTGCIQCRTSRLVSILLILADVTQHLLDYSLCLDMRKPRDDLPYTPRGLDFRSFKSAVWFQRFCTEPSRAFQSSSVTTIG